MTKKLTRAKRKELRAKGQLKVPPRLDEATKAAERRADEEAVSARVQEARAEIGEREPDGEAPAPPKKRRDYTVLLMVGLTAVAGLIYWLTQRPPSQPAPVKPAASSERAPIILTAPPPRAPAPPVTMGEAPAPPLPTGETPRPPPAVPAPAATQAPAPPASAAPAPPAKATPAPPAKVTPAPVEPPRPKPAPAKPKKAEGGDPYG